MPMMGLERPAIGLSLLQSQLAARGHQVRTLYLNWRFAEYIGVHRYQRLGDWLSLPHEAMPGEMVFRATLPGAIAADDPLETGEYAATWRISEAGVALLRELRPLAARFIDDCCSQGSWGDADVIGFTSTFEQNAASLSLAARIKSAFPSATVVFGGANWEGEMGIAQLERFSFVDYACLGEADHSFPELVDAIAAGCPPGPIAGVASRSGHVPARPVFDLDALPGPDYGDFAEVLATSELADEVRPTLLVQTARGCWFGERSHCTFCGLNGSTLIFRSKSPQRAAAEIIGLRDRYGIADIDAVDEILDLNYLRTMLPMLSGPAGADLRLFYEVKSNLSHSDVGMLAAGRVTNVQPGLEAMCDRVLRMMRKGTTVAKNVQFLKSCVEYGIVTYWNLLYAIPGESPADYEETCRVIERIWWLPPPAGGAVRLRIDRFSPYHGSPAEFGIAGMRPSPAYRHVYGGEDADFADIAYYFTADFEHAGDCAAASRMRALVGRWQADDDRGELRSAVLGTDELLITDTRPGARAEQIRLTGWQARLFQRWDIAQDQIAVSTWAEQHEVAATAVRRFIGWCDRRRLVLTVSGKVVNLAVHQVPCPVSVSDGDTGSGLAARPEQLRPPAPPAALRQMSGSS